MTSSTALRKAAVGLSEARPSQASSIVDCAVMGVLALWANSLYSSRLALRPRLIPALERALAHQVLHQRARRTLLARGLLEERSQSREVRVDRVFRFRV